MDFNIEVRKKQLENLEQFISSSTDRIESVLHYLGWTAEKVEKEAPETMVVCPINASHKMPERCLKEHIKKCYIKNEGYDLNEPFLSEPTHDPQQSIILDYNKKVEILYQARMENPYFRPAWNGHDPDPHTSNRLLSTYSPDERLELYNYSIKNTHGPKPPPEFTTTEDVKKNSDKPLTMEEILAKERDAKRRRAKYKSVHINKKNYIEVMREVINGQMEEYKEWLSAKNCDTKSHQSDKDCNSNNEESCLNNTKEKIEDNERPHSSISRNSNYSGSSRSTNRKHADPHKDKYDRNDRYRRSRDRDRSPNRNRRHRSKERRDVSRERRVRSREKRSISRDRERRNVSRDGRCDSRDRRDNPRDRRNSSRDRRHASRDQRAHSRGQRSRSRVQRSRSRGQRSRSRVQRSRSRVQRSRSRGQRSRSRGQRSRSRGNRSRSTSQRSRSRNRRDVYNRRNEFRNRRDISRDRYVSKDKRERFRYPIEKSRYVRDVKDESNKSKDKEEENWDDDGGNDLNYAADKIDELADKKSHSSDVENNLAILNDLKNNKGEGDSLNNVSDNTKNIIDKKDNTNGNASEKWDPTDQDKYLSKSYQK